MPDEKGQNCAYQAVIFKKPFISFADRDETLHHAPIVHKAYKIHVLNRVSFISRPAQLLNMVENANCLPSYFVSRAPSTLICPSVYLKYPSADGTLTFNLLPDRQGLPPNRDLEVFKPYRRCFHHVVDFFPGVPAVYVCS
jgi:hypothetical protein